MMMHTLPPSVICWERNRTQNVDRGASGSYKSEGSSLKAHTPPEALSQVANLSSHHRKLLACRVHEWLVALDTPAWHRNP